MGKRTGGSDRNDGLTPLTLFNVEQYDAAHKPTQRRLKSAMQAIDALTGEENRLPSQRLADLRRVMAYTRNAIDRVNQIDTEGA